MIDPWVIETLTAWLEMAQDPNGPLVTLRLTPRDHTWIVKVSTRKETDQ